MPTPSSSNDNNSRPYAFASTCPEEQTVTTSQSPSSWRPLPPPPYTTDAIDHAPREERLDSEPPPHPAPSRDDGSDPRPAGSSDDNQKAAEIDEAMTRTDGDETAARESSTTQDGVIHPGRRPRRRRRPNMSISESFTPMGLEDDSGEALDMHYGWDDEYSIGFSEFPSLRVIPTTPSSYLRPGSKFYGTQQSERQVYDVQVEIKHVDLRESFLCGYLRIQGLTEDHPTLTTYFEGEIIGPKYGFITKHESWGANDKTDLTHWSKFAAFRPLAKAARKGGGGAVIKDVAQREHIFMRWKEHFLVPDHRVRTINGASFEGFYYICFNQIRGEVTGIYFHSKSEKFQQLELKHVEDKGCFSAIEFR